MDRSEEVIVHEGVIIGRIWYDVYDDLWRAWSDRDGPYRRIVHVVETRDAAIADLMKRYAKGRIDDQANDSG